MPQPRIHADTAAKNRAAAAAFRQRRKSLSPIQRLASDLNLPDPYTTEEAEDLAILKALIAEVEKVAGRLNQSLASRLGEGSPFAAELAGYTRIQVPSH